MFEFVSNDDGTVLDTLVLKDTQRCFVGQNIEHYFVIGLFDSAMELLYNVINYLL